MKHNVRNYMTKTALVLCAALIVNPMSSVTAANVTSYEQYRSGQAAQERAGRVSEYTVVSVSTEEELAELAENCRIDAWSRDKLVRLENNIELSEYKDLMIPSFGGIFEGGDYEISGLSLTERGSSVGLFRYIQTGAVVRNLTVSGSVAPEGSAACVGILCGINYGRIQNCSVTGSVEGDSEVGGIAGQNAGTGEIRKSSSRAVILGNHFTGGICGSNYGTLNGNTNYGNINTYSTEVSYELDDITMERLEDINSMTNVAAHTDSGGIAGYSQGKIYYCANEGTVGYQHVGYNTGGIVGRLHQGYVQNCTNTGHVLGRKDVGGIVGQMEPFLEVQYLADKLDEIDRETDKFLDMLDTAQKDFSHYGKEASTLSKQITADLNTFSQASGDLLSTANDLWYIYNQELTGISEDLKRLNEELDRTEPTPEPTSTPEPPSTPEPTSAPEPTATPEGGQTIEIPVSGGDVIELPIGGGEIELPSGGEGGIELPSGGENGIELPSGSDGVIEIPVSGGDAIQIPNYESYWAALKRFGESAGNHLGNMTDATNERSDGISENLNTANESMRSAADNLQKLADVLEEGSDKTSQDMDALTEQARVLRKLFTELRDDLFRYEKIEVEDISDEAAGGDMDNLGAAPYEDEAYYDTTSFQQGKITLCINRGIVEADTNVGGIVGQVATEYDFDPEDDITYTGAESFNIEQTVKAVVRESCNLGQVIGKKDYVGGIVGRTEYGAVISCESYGSVTSTGGSYVGGIAGSSSYAIRSCYAMNGLEGKNYVGGIAGKGSDIFYSYAYPSLQYTGEYAGAIAGQVAEDGTLYGNYYVESSLGGIDGVSYEDGAMPLSYVEFCSREEVPERFSEFTVTFVADGVELASYLCHYGDALTAEQIPEIPEKEGSYGVWPEFDTGFITGSKVLEAEYRKWVGSLAAGEAENGKARILVSGEFLPDMELDVTETEEEIQLAVGTRKEDGSFELYSGEVTVRVLCEDTNNTRVEIKGGDCAYTEAETSVMGSYLQFTLEQPGSFRLIQEQGSRKTIIIAAACGGAAVLVVCLLAAKAVKRHKEKRRARKEKE